MLCHRGLVTPYGAGELGRHLVREWFGAGRPRERMLTDNSQIQWQSLKSYLTRDTSAINE